MRRVHTTTTTAALTAALALAGCGGSEPAAAPASSPAAASSAAAPAASSPAAAPSPSTAARALAPNSAQGLGGAVPQVAAPADADAARVVGRDYSLQLLGSAPVDEVAAGVETLRAGAGQRLHLVRYALTVTPDPSASSSSSYSSSSSSSSGDLPTATVVAGGQRIPVPLSEGAESAVAVSVPTDAGSVALELESGAGTPAPPKQGLNLLAMTRLPGAPKVLYRPGGSAARTVELDVSEQLSYTRTLRGSYPVEGQTAVQASQARLAWWLTEQPGQLRTPSRPDRALLVLTVAEGGGFDAVEFPPARWRLSYPGGPSGGQPAKATKQAGGVAPSRQLVWEVPASFTTGTASLSPGSFTDSRGTRLDFGSSALRVPVSFPAGG